MNKFILIFSILCIILGSCGNRVVFQNEKISITNSQMYSNNVRYDSNYYNIIRENEWALACYVKKGKRKIYKTDTSKYKFKFYNDSTIQISKSGDSNRLIQVENFYIFYGFHDDSSYDSKFIFKDTMNLFKDFYETKFVFFENDILHHVFAKHINQNFLILNIHVYNRKSKYRPKRYRLCFQKSG
jgi:hypothetical protein